jgi:hypothetical protein
MPSTPKVMPWTGRTRPARQCTAIPPSAVIPTMSSDPVVAACGCWCSR